MVLVELIVNLIREELKDVLETNTAERCGRKTSRDKSSYLSLFIRYAEPLGIYTGATFKRRLFCPEIRCESRIPR